MKIEEHPNYVLISCRNETVKDFTAELELVLQEKYLASNVIIDFSCWKSLLIEELLNLLELSSNHRSKKNSFVVINNAINPDDIPQEIIVVPTLQEAEDIIEMEEIERDLGF